MGGVWDGRRQHRQNDPRLSRSGVPPVLDGKQGGAVRHQDAGGTIEVYVVGDPDRRRRGNGTAGLLLAFLARASQPSDSIGRSAAYISDEAFTRRARREGCLTCRSKVRSGLGCCCTQRAERVGKGFVRNVSGRTTD